LRPLYVAGVADELSARRLDAHPLVTVFTVTGAERPRTVKSRDLRSDCIWWLMNRANVLDKGGHPHTRFPRLHVGTGA
jgi:hypothetical protein